MSKCWKINGRHRDGGMGGWYGGGRGAGVGIVGGLEGLGGTDSDKQPPCVSANLLNCASNTNSDTK